MWLHLFLGVPQLCKQQTLGLCRQKQSLFSKSIYLLYDVVCFVGDRVCLYLRLCFYKCTNLMPTQCIKGHAQVAVRTGMCLIKHFLVSFPPAGPLAAPQRVACGVGGPSHAKVRSRVCLVTHFLATRGLWWQRIGVFLQHSNRAHLCCWKSRL